MPYLTLWMLPSGCQTVWIQIRPDILSGLIWVQTVCKGYQQMSKVAASEQRVQYRATCWCVGYTVKNWYQFLTTREYLVPIRHVFHTNISHFVKKTHVHVVKLYVACMRILHIDKIPPPPPPDLLHFAFDSNSSHAWHDFIIGAVLTGIR